MKSHPINLLSHPDKLFLLSSFSLETISLLLQTISPLKPDTSYHGCLHSIFVSLKVSWLKPSSSITLSQFLLYANLVWYSKIAHSNSRYSPPPWWVNCDKPLPWNSDIEILIFHTMILLHHCGPFRGERERERGLLLRKWGSGFAFFVFYY